jgi:hypothetical protein
MNWKVPGFLDRAARLADEVIGGQGNHEAGFREGALEPAELAIIVSGLGKAYCQDPCAKANTAT